MNWDLTLIYKTKEDYLKDFSSLDEDVFIKISPDNSNIIIKYLFERYPY